jgi:hypothetical protein
MNVYQWCEWWFWLGSEEDGVRLVMELLSILPESMAVLALVHALAALISGPPTWGGDVSIVRSSAWSHLCGDTAVLRDGDECGTFWWLAPLLLGVAVAPAVLKLGYRRARTRWGPR